MDARHVCPSQQDSCGIVPPKTLPVEIKIKSSNTKKVYVYTVKSLFILRAAKNQKYAEKVRSWRS